MQTIEIQDVFLMPEDGRCPQDSTAKAHLIVAQTKDGNFFAHQNRTNNASHNLTKAVNFAREVMQTGKIKTTYWQPVNAKWVRNSYPFNL